LAFALSTAIRSDCEKCKEIITQPTSTPAQLLTVD